MRKTKINKKWYLHLREERADFHEARPNWEASRLAHMNEQIKEMPEPVLIDVGAEEGDLSALYASWGADVVLIEPAPLFWPRIRETFEVNKLKPLAAFQMFAGEEDRDTPYPTVAYPQDEGFRHLDEHKEVTPQARLDTLCVMIDRYPDIIMIDVEGGELSVLKGARRILEHVKPIVYVSIHPEIMKDRYDIEPKDVHDFMKELGYTSEKLDDDHEEDWVFTPQIESAILT